VNLVGDDVVDISAEGRVRVTPRAPLRPLRALVAAAAAREPGGVVHGPETLVTAEGEHAAVVHVCAPLRQRSLGVVFGDDWMTTIEAVCHAPPAFARFRERVARLTRETELGLGSGRRRCFFYQPPAGWIGLPGAGEAVWLSPRCPRSHGVITAFYARPAGGSPTQLVRRDSSRIVPGARAIHVTDVVLDDGRYRYPLRLETDGAAAAEHAAAFEAVVASVRSLPAPRALALDVNHWID
jgi:hypothetical protein